MKSLRKARVGLAAIGAAATLGVGAASANAYSISGGAYTGVATTSWTMTIAGAYTHSCAASTITLPGVATGSDTTSFTPTVGSCTYFGLPATWTQSGPWEFRVTSGAPGGTTYGLELRIPAGSTTTIRQPFAGCEFTIAGPQVLPGVGSATNVSGGANVTANVSGLSYSSTMCPFGSGSSLALRTNGAISFPGVLFS